MFSRQARVPFELTKS